MLLLMTCAWCVVIYSARVAIFGNPLSIMIRNIDNSLLYRLDKALADEPDKWNDDISSFLHRFSRASLLELGELILETILLVYLIATGYLVIVSTVLLAKNLAMFILGLRVTRRVRLAGNGHFQSLRHLPPWIHIADRISSLVSAIGLSVIFTTIVMDWLSP